MRLMFWMLVAALVGCAFPTPLPTDVDIRAPASGVPKEIAAFSGKWVGKWDGMLDSTLVVEQIQNRDAILIYSVGMNTRFDIKPNFTRARGTFGDDNVLRATLRNGARLSYTMATDGSLNGRYEMGSSPSSGTFKRAEK